MRKLIYIVSAMMIMFLTCLSVAYFKAREPFHNAQKLAEERAKTEAELLSIKKYYLYNGLSTYHTIVGLDEAGTETIVWIPEDKKQEIVIRKMSEGISEQTALEKLVQEENPSEILGIRLGMENNLPIWELAYLDEKANLNYYYILFDSGKWWRKIKNI